MISRGAGIIDTGSGNGQGTVKERSRGVFPVPGAPGANYTFNNFEPGTFTHGLFSLYCKLQLYSPVAFFDAASSGGIESPLWVRK